MKITLQEVEHVARLARLALSEEEKDQMRSQLDRILGYIEKLNQLDTTGVEPTSHVIPMTNVLRDDARVPSVPREEALANAPDRREGFFQVPRIIEQ
ncbi:MAG: Asp-tRNA(Asn)/Glu-tRNA(Gln) amidotransferase subunit GatC [Candidatus Methylomirabilales bacterium]